MLNKYQRAAVCLQLALLCTSALTMPGEAFVDENSSSSRPSKIHLKAQIAKADPRGKPLQGSLAYLDMRLGHSNNDLRALSGLRSGVVPVSAKLRDRKTKLATGVSKTAPRHGKTRLRTGLQTGVSKPGSSIHLRSQTANAATKKTTLHSAVATLAASTTFESVRIQPSAAIDLQQEKALLSAIAGMARPFDLKAVKPCTCGGKGALLTSRHQWAEAAQYYQEEIQNKPNNNSGNPNALNGLAWALAHTGDYDLSIAAATEGLKMAPTYPYLIGTRGYAYLRQGNLKMAEKDLDLAAHLGQNPEDWYYLAICRQRLGKLSDSKAALDIASSGGFHDTTGDWQISIKP